MNTARKYTIGSLFDGSGGFPLAGELCGVGTRWASEVEPYPITVTRKCFPHTKHLGDISKINGAEIEPVDIITFGSPCQDLSVAGKRAGLKHEANGDEETTRSGLFMEAVRIIKEMRIATNGKYPRFALWENVPGAFSSNKGEDFKIVCEELIKIVEPTAVMPEVPKNGWAYADSYVGDGWSLAYRTFDAQYWGVPQRRRRIHLVADFRGECAREVLFEREGVRGYFTQGGTPWQSPPADAQGCPGADGSKGESTIALASVSSTLRAGAGAPKHEQDFVGRLVIEREGFDGYNGDLTGDKSATLGVNCGISTGRNGVIERGGGFDDVDRHILDDQGGQQISVRTDGKAPTLRAETHGNLPCVMERDRGLDAVAFDVYNQAVTGRIAKSLTAKRSDADHVPVAVYAVENHPADSRVNIDESGKVQCLTGRMGTGGGNVPMVMEPKPVYCLQGNGIDRADTAGCNGKGWREDASYTLNTLDRPAVVYAVDQGGGKSSANIIEDKSPTLCTTHGGEPVIALDRASFNQGENAKFDFEITDKGVNSTVVAKGPSAVACSIGNGQVHDALCPSKEVSKTLNCLVDPAKVLIASTRYIVRRLTPTECARLQGFADRWGHIEKKDSLTEEEYEFWLKTRHTYEVVVKGKKPEELKTYTEKQMLTWYNKLWNDSAEYKMWGNGIALPPAIYCMQGMVDVLNRNGE